MMSDGVSTRIVVTGDREWTDRAAIERAFDRFRPTEVVEGECRGLDLLAKEVAKARGLLVLSFPANWDKFGNAAGPYRNIEMLETGPSLVLAFHNNFKRSRGTKSCVNLALSRGLEVWLVTNDNVLRFGAKK